MEVLKVMDFALAGGLVLSEEGFVKPVVRFKALISGPKTRS
jgi:hypothetical protein